MMKAGVSNSTDFAVLLHIQENKHIQVKGRLWSNRMCIIILMKYRLLYESH